MSAIVETQSDPATGIDLPYNWDPRWYQQPLWQYLSGGGKYASCMWHRRAGKDSIGLRYITWAHMRRPGVYWHMLPTQKQARKVIWDGRDDNGKPMLDAWPKELIRRKRDDEMLIETQNRSIYQLCGSDNYDSLMGANPVGVIFSEWSLTDPAAYDYVRPILAANGGWVLFIFTPRGRTDQYKLHERAFHLPAWFAQTLKNSETKVIDGEAIQNDLDSGMAQALVDQEYECSPDAPLIGSYYADQMQWLQEQKPSHISHVSHDPALKVETWWDLGIGDATFIWFVQRVGREIHLIDCYKNSGEPLAHYVNVLKDKGQTTANKQGYIYSNHVFPHDVSARELISGKSREQALHEYGIYPDIIELHNLEDGIEIVRQTLPRCWFDWKKCEKGLASLRAYRKQWDANNAQFKSKPVHDDATHGADAFRYGCMFTPHVRLPSIRGKRKRSIV